MLGNNTFAKMIPCGVGFCDSDLAWGSYLKIPSPKPKQGFMGVVSQVVRVTSTGYQSEKIGAGIVNTETRFLILAG